MTQLAEVEKILGGGNMQTFDSKADHEKLTSDAKTKSMKLFGDAKERKAAKKKEAQKQSTSCIKLIQIWNHILFLLYILGGVTKV